MRIRHAASALVALGAASTIAMAGSVIHQDDARHEAEQSDLRSSSWSVQASTDFGTTWTAPQSAYHGHFPVQVNPEGLRTRPAYQPFTLRTSTDSRAPADIRVGAGVVIDGDPALADLVRIRVVHSAEGTCAAPTFTGDSLNLLSSDRTVPQPVTKHTVDRAVALPGATRTTPGEPVTLCFEVSLTPDAPTTDGHVTLGWPVDVERVPDQT